MITLNGRSYKELRCARCQKFIVYQSISAGILAYQCPKCDFMNEFTFKYNKTMTESIEKEFSIDLNREGGE